MLTARNVIVAAITLAVVSVLAACVSLLRPPGRDGLGDDSYGTRAHGHRALFDTLAELNVPVDRVLVPPAAALHRQITLVLWGPHLNLVATEPVYLRQIRDWLRNGGRVVVAPGLRGALFSPTGFYSDRDEDEDGPESGSVLEELGIEGVGLETVSLDDDGNASPGEQAEEDEPESFLELLRQARAERLPDTRSAAVQADGELKPIETLVAQIDVPADDLQVLDTEGTEPLGRVLIRGAAGDEHVVAATFRQGQGEAVVVSDPRIFENLLIARGDNPVLAWHLIAAPGRPVVFDEFYHGLTIRGNPLYLVARFPFGLIASAVLLVTFLWAWRRAVSIGPALEPRSSGRRALTEYVEAMARLFRRGRRSREFLLQEFRSGALWTLRNELGLSPAREDPEQIVAVLARRDPRRAAEFDRAIAELDALTRSRRINDLDVVQTLQRASACL